MEPFKTPLRRLIIGKGSLRGSCSSPKRAEAMSLPKRAGARPGELVSSPGSYLVAQASQRLACAS